MAKVFKCCKNKINNNWICTVCNNIFHPSCCKRTKNYEIISENFICCSSDCREALKDEENDTTKTLQSLVQELKTELQEKNAYISRLKRNSQACQEDFSVIEDELENRVKKYEDQISNLKAKVEELNLELIKWKTMEDSTPPLALEAAVESSIRFTPDCSITTMQVPVSPKNPVPILPKKTCQFRRLLVMGSYYSVKNIPKLLKLKRNAGSDINCQFSAEPLTIGTMAKMGTNLSEAFGREDHVMLFVDPRSAKERTTLTSSAVKGMMDLYKHTNLIIIGACQSMTSYKQKQAVYEYNLLIKKSIHAVERGGIFVSLDQFTPDDMFSLRRQQADYMIKKNLANFIYKEYLEHTEEMPQAKLSFEERLKKLLGGKQDNWRPKITTFPETFPLPSDALRGPTLPAVHLDSPLPTDIQQNFRKRYPRIELQTN